MTPLSPHVIDELQLRVDGRLDAEGRRRVEAHLAECATCRRAAEELGAVKSAVRRLPEVDVPADLGRRISQALEGDAGRDPSRRRSMLVYGLAAAAIVVLAVWLWPARSLPREASRQAARVESGEFAFEFTTTSPSELERQFAARGVPVRVLDLAMMQLVLTGGSVVSLDGRPTALYAYRRPDGLLVICQMVKGALSDLPAPATTLDHRGFRFQVYRDGARTLVFWEEGDTLCVLAATAAEAEVIELAKGKAMKPA